jgi:hypothetical protein
MVSGHESDHERATIERLKLLGYEYLQGPEINRNPKEVILADILKSTLAYRHPALERFRGGWGTSELPVSTATVFPTTSDRARTASSACR